MPSGLPGGHQPDSLKVITAHWSPPCEPPDLKPASSSSVTATSCDRIDSKDGAPVFNRTVTLRDTWKK
jgi:glutaminyl-tRNA synthetase